MLQPVTAFMDKEPDISIRELLWSLKFWLKTLTSGKTFFDRSYRIEGKAKNSRNQKYGKNR